MPTKYALAVLTLHARQRIEERFRITPEELIDLLNAGLWKKIGISAVSSIAHRLLWSPKDELPLVAIQEVVTGTVLTVLTVEMYTNTYTTNMTERRLQNVINKMVLAGHLPQSRWTPEDNQINVVVFAFQLDSPNRISLGSYRSDVDSTDLALLGQRQEFWRWVAERLVQRGHSLDNISSVGAHIAGGDYQEIPFN